MDKAELEGFIKRISDELNNIVFNKIHNELIAHPGIRQCLCPAFPYPLKVRIGILKNCLAIEYIGPGNEEDDHFSIEGTHAPYQDVYDFLCISIKHLKPIGIPISESIENVRFLLGDSVDYLTDYFYDFTQLPSDFMLNGYVDFSEPKEPQYVSNTTFFWTDEEGKLKIKHIDFLELVPFDADGNVMYRDDNSLNILADFLLNHRVPPYRIELHGVLNDFIELINLPESTEPDITRYLGDHPEILQLAFGAGNLNPQILLEWQYNSGKTNLQPDFLPTKMDGYADILEFKLPHLKNNPVVGPPEREHPSFEVDSAISQLETYEEWCSQVINTSWLEQTKGIKILYPRKYLVIGHSKDFSKEDRARLRATRNTTVYTYDEFIEMMRYQIYRVR